ncbi:MAG: CAF17-like 4Fe-4S cluster assembly/insertion protein YgfZ [Alphaproteobacteria bacterium]
MPQFAALPARALLSVTGPEARPFLQGLISNDIERAATGRAIHAALLTAQGKYLHDFFIAARGDGALLIDCEAARRDDLRKRLTIYRLRSKTIIEVLDGWSVFAVWGDGALPALGLGADAGTAASFGEGVAFVDPRLAALGARVLLPGGDADMPAGFTATDADAYDRWRLFHGVADGSRDLEPEKSILLESNFEELNGVDFNKGCYVGQELTARTKYRGLVKKKLVPVELSGSAPEPGTQIMLDGKDAGTMRSARDGHGLALLRLDALDAAKGTLTAGDTRLVPRLPGWMRLPEKDAT